MIQDAENTSTMPDPHQDIRRLRARIKRRRYVVDERAVADAMLSRPMMRLFLAPPDRNRRFAA
jgi:anti-sigma28 factor (negative regulator of flagellin synthesis)